MFIIYEIHHPTTTLYCPSTFLHGLEYPGTYEKVSRDERKYQRADDLYREEKEWSNYRRKGVRRFRVKCPVEKPLPKNLGIFVESFH